MKTYLPFHKRPARVFHQQENAFALVAVITLLVLVALVCLGLLSLSSLSMRGGQRAEAQARAQANARMSLMLAIGQLQKTLGPDTRVSAPASLSSTNVGQPRWVGAYNTLNPATNLPPVGHMASGSLLQWSTDARAGQSDWRDKYRLGWLVSQAPGSNATPDNPGSDLVTIAEIPTTAGTADRVMVPRVPVMDGNRRTGNYAYWISDESAKARLDQIDPRGMDDPTLSLDEKANSLIMAQRVDATKTEGYDWHGAMTPAIASKLVTTENLELAATDPKLASKRRDSFTVHSQSVLSDPVTGGLKIDLGAYVDATSAGDPNIDLRNWGRGVLSDKVSFVPGLRYALTGADYGSLRGWRRVGLDANGPTVDPTQIAIEPRFPANRATNRAVGASSRVYEGRIPDVDNANRVNVTRSSGAVETGAPIHPVISDARFTVDFVYDNSSAGEPKILPLIYPRVKIWNPYNAKLTAANYVVVMPFRTSGNADFQIAGNGPGIPAVNLNNILNNASFSNPLRYFVFSVRGAAFGPGECKVFMPDFSANGQTLPRSGGSPYAMRYDKDDIANNRLTDSVSNTPNGAFFLDSTQTFTGTVLTGGNKPNIRCTTSQHVFYSDAWFLKGATGLLNVSAAHVLDASQGANFPSLQSVYMGLRGIENYSSGVDEWEFTWDNTGTREFMSQSDGRLAGNVFAPKQWARHLRLLYPGEVPTKFNNLDRTASALHITSASAADWNPRANIHTRFPTSLSLSWYWRWRHPFLCPVEREDHSILAAGTAASGDSYVASPFWPESASANNAEHFTFFDVQPATMPMLSIGRLRHASLSPFGWQPAYPIGSSRAPFYANATTTVFPDVASRTAGDQWSKLRAGSTTSSSFQDIVGDIVTASGNDQMLLYDTAFEANCALFDRYFFSGMPRNAAGRTQWNGTDPLANSRLKRYESVYPGQPSTVLATPAEEALKPAAMFLQSGSFNVNSTDVEAWKALLSHLRETKRKTVGGEAKSKHPYSRTFAPYEADGPESGPYSSANFAGLPALDDDKIAALAEAIVDEVKTRGPFLSMADFINHRLAPDKSGAPDPTSLYGTLDAAIETTSINSKPQDASVKQTGLQVADTEGFGSSNLSVDYRRMSPSRMSGMPGSLTQGDLLEPLAPVITVRGDTFVVRAYGEAVAANGNVEARAWCEAVVQRVPEYLQSRAGTNGAGNEPHTPVLTESWANFPSNNRQYATGTLTENSALTPMNKTFGRTFRITGFRWVTPEDRAS